ncbi:GNAT family N-acetyltransferase [Nocardioides zeae]|uniref:Lysine N-acyltransferase MbtK n=1 Tax=Nocardioides imazamoxiresistens TaxID=3231893 RepID=A0ABU3Q1P3_9ACTN|nr:GNAT family N-acetyltransferase [Nocardioides zeae]MDT9595056.1 GNAT family N-acetyltransferase [Nocardioides zeae]
MTAPDPTTPTLTTRPFDVDADVALLHRWVTNPRARFWGLEHASLEQVREEYARLDADPHHDVRLGLADGVPAFLVETYDPHHHELAAHTTLRPGDLGMHFLVAPTDRPVHGFTRAVITAVLTECFADPTVERVVVEPDAANTRVHDLNAAMGFVVEGEVALSDKTALLSTCTRAAFDGRTR